MGYLIVTLLLSQSHHVACEAHGDTYFIALHDNGDMAVSRNAGPSASGHAIRYRAGTRYYLPTGSATGVKLSLEASGTRMCLGAGGTDCHPCRVVADPRTSFVWKRSCSAQSPRG